MSKHNLLIYTKKFMQFYRRSKHKSKTCKRLDIARTTLNVWVLLEQWNNQLKQPKAQNAAYLYCIHDL